MPLLALDLLARVITMRIDAGPPYMRRCVSRLFICGSGWLKDG
jgi:hypothetical protein